MSWSSAAISSAVGQRPRRGGPGRGRRAARTRPTTRSVVGVEHRLQLVRVGGQPADGAELGGREAEVAHLGEDAIDGELRTPPGTSQMPHEIGAPATLAMIPASVIPPTWIAPAPQLPTRAPTEPHCVGALQLLCPLRSLSRTSGASSGAVDHAADHGGRRACGRRVAGAGEPGHPRLAEGQRAVATRRAGRRRAARLPAEPHGPQPGQPADDDDRRPAQRPPQPVLRRGGRRHPAPRRTRATTASCSAPAACGPPRESHALEAFLELRRRRDHPRRLPAARAAIEAAARHRAARRRRPPPAVVGRRHHQQPRAGGRPPRGRPPRRPGPRAHRPHRRRAGRGQRTPPLRATARRWPATASRATCGSSAAT